MFQSERKRVEQQERKGERVGRTPSNERERGKRTLERKKGERRVQAFLGERKLEEAKNRRALA